MMQLQTLQRNLTRTYAEMQIPMSGFGIGYVAPNSVDSTQKYKVAEERKLSSA